MGRIIIDYSDTLGAAQALIRVRAVVHEGKISEAAGVAHYCWVTTFMDDTVVTTRRKKPGQTSDSFLVCQSEES